MTTVVDASLVVAALVEPGPDGGVGRHVPRPGRPGCPHLLPAEVANVLRRLVAARSLSPTAAWQAQRDLAGLPIVLYPFAPFAERAWGLRANLTPYDAWYVAMAEELEAPLATLDRRMVRAPGPRCRFLTPDREADPGAGTEPDGGQGRRPT